MKLSAIVIFVAPYWIGCATSRFGTPSELSRDASNFANTGFEKQRHSVS